MPEKCQNNFKISDVSGIPEILEILTFFWHFLISDISGIPEMSKKFHFFDIPGNVKKMSEKL